MDDPIGYLPYRSEALGINQGRVLYTGRGAPQEEGDSRKKLGKSFLTPSLKADSMCDCIDDEFITKLLGEREKRPIRLEPLEEEPIAIEVKA